MTVLGIDPGIERLGYGVVALEGGALKALSYGLVTTDRKDRKEVRLKQIFEDVRKLIKKNKPDLVSVETLIFAKNVKTAMVISEVRGVILALAALEDKPLAEFTPLQVKTAVSGYGRSNKSQIGRSVQLILGLKEIPKPDDVSDALAIAICGAAARKAGELPPD